MDNGSLSQRIKQEAALLGFSLCKIAPVSEATNADFFEGWIAQGRAGEMRYLERHIEKRRFPYLLAEKEQQEYASIIVLAVDYHQFDLPSQTLNDPSRGIIASYAWGDDYHDIIRPLLYELDGFIARQCGRYSQGKCLVDTGPVLERDWAAESGLGFTGKNCCSINPELGSWLFLATILVPEVLVYDPPPPVLFHNAPSLNAALNGLPADTHFATWRVVSVNSEPDSENTKLATCGRCTRCIDACPTDAFIGAFHLDPQRCISYWTIEAQGAIPRSLRPHFGNRIFGCDICQEVCPWNGRLPKRRPQLEALWALESRIAPPLLQGFLAENPYWLEPEAFSRHFQRSPIKRAKRSGMLRNVCIALGNWADHIVVDSLLVALQDSEPIVRGHAAWALGRVVAMHGDERASGALRAAKLHEREESVREEIEAALRG